MTTKTKFNGLVIYRGLSALDNETPIVVIATGFNTTTSNPKTGNMIQTWILLENEYPSQAVNNGNDYAICGNCPHRKYEGKRSCYVNIMGPGSVYKAYKAGNYPDYIANKHSDLFRDRALRFGSYGDPVNIPLDIVRHLAKLASNHTGYTHQWHMGIFDAYQPYFQASVDSILDFVDAEQRGWSTFRVRSLTDTTKIDGEVNCQGGKKTFL